MRKARLLRKCLHILLNIHSNHLIERKDDSEYMGSATCGCPGAALRAGAIFMEETLIQNPTET